MSTQSCVIGNFRIFYEYKISIYTLLILGVLLLLLGGCEKEKPIPVIEDPENPENPDNTEKPEEGNVVVLKPSDIQDYYKIYKPNEFKDMDWLREDSKWSFVRSRQSEHFIVLWEKGFGDNPNATSLSEALRVDIDDLLKKAESFFTTNIEKLKFADLGKNSSNLDKYKMQIYLFCQTDWMAYGSGYDDVIGALWVSPATCKPVGSTIAHEIGHSFQYQVYADLLASGKVDNNYSRGFRYGFGGDGGNTFWEQTAQWQSFQSYPAEVFESYNFNVYTENHHRHICHEWQRYASYFIHYYWTQKYGTDFVGKLWRESVSPEDPMEAYMRINKLSTDQFNQEMYEAVTRFVTWDIDEIRARGEKYIGKQTCRLYPLSKGAYQVAYSHCPGTTGYNVIPLNVPEVGKTIVTNFSGLQPGSLLASKDPGLCKNGEQTITVTKYNSSDPARAGWKYGYVALLKNGERLYGKMNSEASGNVEFTIPDNCEKLWFVVLGAPSTYQSHAWDEKEINDDQWPYTVKFTGTDILGNIVIDPDASPQDIMLSYNLTFPADNVSYSGIKVNLIENRDISKIAQAFAMQPSDISEIILEPRQTPQEGKIAFAAMDPDDTITFNTTANGHGFWFDAGGGVVGWGDDSILFAEFSPSGFVFSIGQFPGKCKAGDKFTVKEMLIYTKEGKKYKATLTFHVTITE